MLINVLKTAWARFKTVKITVPLNNILMFEFANEKDREAAMKLGMVSPRSLYESEKMESRPIVNGYEFPHG